MRRSPRSFAAAVALVLALLTGFATGITRASAADPFPNGGIATLASDHFLLHWNRANDDPVCPNEYITQVQAGDVLGMAERAYALYTSWGYPAPILDSDGDSLVDMSVDDFLTPCTSYGIVDPSIPRDPDGSFKRWDAFVNPVAPAGAGELHLNPKKDGLTYHVIAHEVFHLFQHAVNPVNDPWLEEGTAEWAAVRAEGALGGDEQNADRTADCVGSECGDTDFDRNGYPGWLLFEYVAERYGDGAVKEIWDQVAANPGAPGTTDLSNVLANHGTTLSAFFGDYATARLTGSFTLPQLKGATPAANATIATGDTSGALASTTLAVNHLAVRFIGLLHGSAGADGSEPCYAATLTLSVALPAGVTSAPTFYANSKGSVAEPLVVSGSSASLTVPWNTCAGSPEGFLSLPNASLGLDGREFVVSGSITVDPSTPASPSEPPVGAPVSGPVVPGPTTEGPPKLTLYAPEVLRVSAKTRVLRFVIFSGGSGTLRATLGSTRLGSAGLRAGSNDVRFVLPKTLVRSLRRTSAAGNVLRLTSYSPSGLQGSTITRRVAIKATKKRR